MIHRNGMNRRGRAGATVAETAVVLSLLVAILLGVFEYGRVVMIRHLLTNAAREGARMAVVGTALSPTASTQDIVKRVEIALADRRLENLEISVHEVDPSTGEDRGEWGQAGFGSPIAVHITCDYSPVLPTTLGILPERFRLSAVSLMRSEAN